MTTMTRNRQAVIFAQDIEAEFTFAYNHYSGALVRYAYHKLHDSKLCEDLVQDTFMKVWKYVSRGEKVDMMKAFLYRILSNLIIDEYRKRKSSSLDSLMDKGFEPEINTIDQMVNMIDGGNALQVSKQLPEKYRSLIQMRYVEELSLEEMADRTGCTKNTLAVQLHRALPKLRTLCTHETV